MQKFNASKFLRNFLRGTIMRQKYKFPDFLIIGTMKGGTTRLYDFITMHSAIERAKQKEIHYFSLYYNKGDEWYLSHFPAHKNMIIGEASPTYFHLAYTTTIPSLMKNINNKIKIILIVRDPVERAVSHYNHFCKVNKVQDVISLDVNEFFGVSENEVISRSTDIGFYVHQALTFSLYRRNYLNYEALFDRKDLLVLSTQNLRESPFETMKEVYRFLGVGAEEYDEFKVVKYAHGTDITKLNRKTFTRLSEVLYPDFEKFCRRVGFEYKELDLQFKNLATDSSLNLAPVTASFEDTSRKLSLGDLGIKLKQEISKPDVHIGKDGWLFLLKGSNNSIEFYKKPNLFDEALQNAWRELLNRRIKYFSEHKIKYIHLFVPNKLTIYPEYYKDILPYYEHTPLLKLWQELIQQNEIEILQHVINPIEYFDKLKQTHQLFWKTDTHWTFYGVFGAYQLICAKLGIQPQNELLNRKQNRARLIMDEGGKLDPPIYEEASFFQVQKDSNRIFANELVRYTEDNNLEKLGTGLHLGSNVIFKNNLTKNRNKVIIFGDSFSEYRPNYLTGVLAETFQETHFVWSTSIDFKYVEKVKPDIVITEIVERFMPKVPEDDFNLDIYVKNKIKQIK